MRHRPGDACSWAGRGLAPQLVRAPTCSMGGSAGFGHACAHGMCLTCLFLEGRGFADVVVTNDAGAVWCVRKMYYKALNIEYSLLQLVKSNTSKQPFLTDGDNYHHHVLAGSI